MGYLRRLKPGGPQGPQDEKAPLRDTTWPPQTPCPRPSWTSAAAACRPLRSPTRPACQSPVAAFKGQGHTGIKEAERAPEPKHFSTCPALDFSPWMVNKPGRGSPSMPTCPTPGLSLQGPPPPNTWPLAVLFRVILFCFVYCCCCWGCCVVLVSFRSPG